MIQKTPIQVHVALVAAIIALVVALWPRSVAEVGVGVCSCEAYEVQLEALRAQLAAVNPGAGAGVPAAPLGAAPLGATAGAILPPAGEPLRPPPTGRPAALPSDPPPPLFQGNLDESERFDAGGLPPPPITTAPLPVDHPGRPSVAGGLPSGMLMAPDVGVPAGIHHDEDKVALHAGPDAAVVPPHDMGVKLVEAKPTASPVVPDPTPRIHKPDAGVTADSGLDKFIRFDSSNDAVALSIGPDGELQIVNSDPELAGTELTVSGHTRSGRVLPVVIKIPAVAEGAQPPE